MPRRKGKTSKKRAPTEALVDAFQEQIKNAIKNYSDVDYLGTSPLMNPALISSYLEAEGAVIDRAARGRALQRVLEKAVARLKPSGDSEYIDENAEQYYQILYTHLHKDRLGISNIAIHFQTQHYISERTYYRKLDEAIDALSRVLEDLLVDLPLLLERPPLVKNFVGRREELAYYQDMLTQEGMVIIEGLGGVGKSSLGAEMTRYIDMPIFWLTLRQGLTDNFDAVLAALARFLEKQGHGRLWRFLQIERQLEDPYPAHVKLNQLLNLLKQDDYMLCFDNVEVLIPARPEHQSILSLFGTLISERIPLILISRQRPALEIRTEYTMLTGLALSDTEQFLNQCNIHLSAELLKTLHYNTGGNPRLLELFVAWVEKHHENQGFDVNTPGVEEFIASMSSVKGVEDHLIHEVYNALTETERAVVQSISIFRRPIDAPSLQRRLEEAKIVPNVLNTLLTRYVIRVDQLGALYLHPVLGDLVRQRLTSNLHRELHTWAGGFYEERGDYLEAAYHYTEATNVKRAILLLVEHLDSIINRGQAQAAIDLLEKVDRHALPSPIQVALGEGIGRLYTLQGRYPEAQRRYEDILPLASEDAPTFAVLHRLIGNIHRGRGEYNKAIEYYRKGVLIFSSSLEAENSRFWERLGNAEAYQGRLDFALIDCQRALYEAHNALGLVYWRRGNYTEALSHYHQAAKVAEGIDDKMGRARILSNIGIIYRDQGKTAEAITNYKRSLAISTKLGAAIGNPIAHLNLGLCYNDIGEYDTAIAEYEHALSEFQNLGDAYGVALAYINLADVHKDQKEYEKAVTYAVKATQICTERGYEGDMPDALRILGEASLGLGNTQDALDYCQQALAQAEKIGSLNLEAYTHWSLARVYGIIGNADATVEHYDRAVAMFEELGCERELTEIQEERQDQ